MCYEVKYRGEKVRADGAHVQSDLRLIKLKLQSVVWQFRYKQVRPEILEQDGRLLLATDFRAV